MYKDIMAINLHLRRLGTFLLSRETDGLHLQDQNEADEEGMDMQRDQKEASRRAEIETDVSWDGGSRRGETHSRNVALNPWLYRKNVCMYF